MSAIVRWCMHELESPAHRNTSTMNTKSFDTRPKNTHEGVIVLFRRNAVGVKLFGDVRLKPDLRNARPFRWLTKRPCRISGRDRFERGKRLHGSAGASHSRDRENPFSFSTSLISRMTASIV